MKVDKDDIYTSKTRYGEISEDQSSPFYKIKNKEIRLMFICI